MASRSGPASHMSPVKSPNRGNKARTAAAPLSPYGPPASIPFPVEHAGTLDSLSSTSPFKVSRAVLNSSNAAADARRRELIDMALKMVDEEVKQERAEPTSFHDALRRHDPANPALPLTHAAASPSKVTSRTDWSFTEERVTASISGDPNAERIRQLTAQHVDLQRTAARKVEQLERVEQQLADMTRVVEAQARQREHLESLASARAARERAQTQALEDLQSRLALLEQQRMRDEHALAVEQSSHMQTKMTLKATLEQQEAKWRSVRADMDERESQRSDVEKHFQQYKQQLEERMQMLISAEATAQEKIHSLESQLRASKQDRLDMEAGKKKAEADSQYLAREVENMKQKLEIKLEESHLAEQNVEKHKSLLDQLSRELHSLREDHAITEQKLNALPSLQRDSSLFEQLKKQHVELQEMFANLEIEKEHQTNLRVNATNELKTVLTRMEEQNVTLTKLQQQHQEHLGETVRNNDLKNQLNSANLELENAKSLIKSLQTSLVSTTAQAAALNEELVTIQNSRDEWHSKERNLRDQIEARYRSLRMVLEQVRSQIDKNPFNKKLPASASSVSSSTIAAQQASKDAINDALNPIHEPLSNTPSTEQEFTLLREQLNSALLELNARTRHAFSLFLDQEQLLTTTTEEVAEKRKALHAAQLEIVEQSSEATSRYQVLETQLYQTQQDLLVARSDAEDRNNLMQSHRAQVKSLWNAIQLLHRAYKPLSRRFEDVVRQKELVQVIAHTAYDRTAREILELRKALCSFEEASRCKLGADGKEESPFANRPAHPYRLHTPKISFRALVIGVLAARRFWLSSDNRYGVALRPVHGEAGPTLFLAPSTHDNSSSLVHSSSATQNEREQRKRDREMIVPALDESDLPHAGASLMKLIEHLETQHTVNNIVYPQLQRPGASSASMDIGQRLLHAHSLASQRSLLSTLAAGFKHYYTHWRRRAVVTAVTPTPPPKSSTDDIALIRSVALLLANRNKQLQEDFRALQAQHVDMISRSTATQEALTQEQARALDQLRQTEMNAEALITQLRDQVFKSENEKTKLVSQHEYMELHSTSELVLRQCRDLERSNVSLKEELVQVKAELKKQSDGFIDQLMERDVSVRTLRHTVEERQKQLAQLDLGSSAEMQRAQAELSLLRAHLNEKENEARDAKMALQQLQTSYSALEVDRFELASSFDETSRELIRVQQVLRSISAAHDLAAEHHQEMARVERERERVHAGVTAALMQDSFTSIRASSPMPPLPHIPFTSPSSISERDHHNSSTASAPIVSSNVGNIHVRHHPNGNLSLDFGSSTSSFRSAPPTAPTQHSITSTLQPGESALPLLHTYTATPLTSHSKRAGGIPSVPARLVPSSTSSAATAPVDSRAFSSPHSVQPVRGVKFASDTKM